MSHVATVQIEIKDLQALADAAKALGIEFVEGQKTYRCWGSGKTLGEIERYQRMVAHRGALMPEGFTLADMGKCEHALRLKGNGMAYEIGVTPRRDGKPGYQLLWDESGAKYSWTPLIGEGMSNLKQAYATEVAVRAAKRQGFRVVGRHVKQDGKIELKLQR